MTPTKILFIFPFDISRQGGVETQSNILINELGKDKNYKITVILPSESKWEPLSNNVYCRKLPRYNINIDPWNGILFLGKNFKEIKKEIENNDIIHIQHNDITSSFGYILKKITNKKIVLVNHGMMSENKEYCKLKLNIKEPLRQFIRILPIKFFEKKSIESADKVITVSQYLKNLSDRIDSIVIYNGIDCDLFNSNTKPSLIKTKKYTVICPGRITYEKGQDVLISALPYITNVEKNIEVIFGESYKENLINMATKLNMCEYIAFSPFKKYENIPSFYKSADVIVVPSRFESFGIVIIENLSLGNIIVASNIGGIPELIEHGSNGFLVPPNDPKMLSDQILKALNENEMLLKIKSNAIKSSKEFDIDKMVKKYKFCYEGVINDSNILCGNYR